MSVGGAQNDQKIVLFVGLFPSFFLSISESNFRCLGIPHRCFRMECIAKIDFAWKSFLVNFGIEFYCFLGALGAVFLIFQASKTSLKTKRFLMTNRILRCGSGDADRGGSSALSMHKSIA